jgi:exodeoxyribonuclease V alpha subunit
MPDLSASGLFAALDLHFAGFIRRFGGAEPDVISLSAALVSRATGGGDVCLDLNAWEGRPLVESRVALACPPAERWIAALRACPAVGRPGERRPLVLDHGNRLYLHRYWEYEHRLAAGILDRAGAPPETLDAEALKAAMQCRTDGRGGAGIDWQQVAVAVCLLKRFAVITGGPGSGKTTTVTKILCAWEDLHGGRPTRVCLAAPTGKAAARLQESLQPLAGRPGRAADAGPAYEVHTLHRLLRPVAGTPLFHYHAGHPLAVDLMIVDEVSMVDLALMAKLMDALPASARLVLIGDRDQLASVEAGSVLGDICGRARQPGFSPEMGEWIRRATGQAVPQTAESRPLQDSIVELQTSHRFAAGSAIEALSRAVNRGDASGALAILARSADGSVRWQEPQPGAGGMADLEQRLTAGYAAHPPQGDPAAMLQELNRFKVLCAHRRGSDGAEALNRLAERALMRAGRIRPRRPSPWYAGRPVLITQNDYRLGLFNGDIGIALSDSVETPEGLAVYFTDAAGGLRRFLPYRLPEHETVYALTVHKSQGSEFEEVLLLLPAEDSPVLSRELLYTALTRARKRITLLGRREVLTSAIHRRIERTSGLRDALWRDGRPP